MSNILELFPTPVYYSKLEKNFSKKELNLVFKLEQTKISHGKFTTNGRSQDSYVLNNLVFKNRKKEIFKHINHYFNKILNIKNLKPKITQSWITYLDTYESFPPHTHANSFLSGVFYIKSNANIDSISFYKDQNFYLNPNFIEYNVYNSSSWRLPVNTLDIIIFPSFLKHGISTKEDKSKRISLAFNVFVEGNLGNEYTLDYLKL